MRSPPLVVRSRRVLCASGPRPADLIIDEGRIAQIAPFESTSDDHVTDAGESVVMAAAVDTHVHINEPGRTQWEGFQTATRAAAAGGIQLVADMPLNSSPVCTDVEALRVKRQALEQHRTSGKIHCDVLLYAGLVPANAGDEGVLQALASEGVAGFKAFLCASGLDDFPAASRHDLEVAMPVLAACGSRLLAHAELVPSGSRQVSGASFADFVASRPESYEVDAIELLGELSSTTGCPVHVVHVSSAEGVDAIERFKDRGLPMTAETCPHYLTFAAGEIPDGKTVYKCTPPIRAARHREALWQALESGVLDFVATDHSPCPPADKHLESGDLGKAWGGIASLQLLLPALWTGLHSRTDMTQEAAVNISLRQLSRWVSSAPGKFLSPGSGVGVLAEGHPANLVVWDPKSTFEVEASQLEHRHALTPYEGRTLHGVVEQTYLRGELTFDRGTFHAVEGGERQAKQ